MKITVFSAKGGVGKTPISVNMALDRGWAIGTNETYHVLEHLTAIPDGRTMAIDPAAEFPKLPPEIDIVFDLSGTLGGDTAHSIVSAVEQSDFVLVPVPNEYKAINSAFHTIAELQKLNKNIVIIATKLQKQKNEDFADWAESKDCTNVRDTLSGLLEKEYPVFPLKYSKVFDVIFDKEKSIRQMVDGGGIDAYTYRMIAWQFDKIYQYLDSKVSQ